MWGTFKNVDTGFCMPFRKLLFKVNIWLQLQHSIIDIDPFVVLWMLNISSQNFQIFTGIPATQCKLCVWGKFYPVCKCVLRFQISNTDHIIDVNSEPGRYQQINIICPKYSAFSPLMVRLALNVSNFSFFILMASLMCPSINWWRDYQMIGLQEMHNLQSFCDSKSPEIIYSTSWWIWVRF